MEEIQQRIEEFADAERERVRVKEDVEEVVRPEFVDLYKQRTSAANAELKKTRPNGSSPRVNVIAQKLIDGEGSFGLGRAYKEYKDKVEKLKEGGEKRRAEIVKKQYMDERFLPAVETIIRYSSPDELLNCRDALEALDELALGVGGMNGYTASYIRQAYGDLLGSDLDGRFNTSDPFVSDTVRRIKRLIYDNNIRAAVGAAEQAKKQIDRGEHIANDDDYSIIVRVANF